MITSRGMRLIGSSALAGFFLMGGLLTCLWVQESGLLSDAHRAEGERLFQAFAAPLARAVAQNDDLARIDELRRLQKLPGVASSRVLEITEHSENALVWEGKTVGTLEIRLKKNRWRLWRYRWLERAFSLCLLMSFGAALFGLFLNRASEQSRRRAVQMLLRQRSRLNRLRRREEACAQSLSDRRLAQVAEWAAKGLLMLDGNQRLRLANGVARRCFNLGETALGFHWMDHTASPEWAQALRRSIENPGLCVPGPANKEDFPVLITHLKPGDSEPESTWITTGRTLFEPAGVIK